MAIMKLDKNRLVRLRYTKLQKGYSKTLSEGGNAPDFVAIVYQGKRIEIPYGDESDLLMPFRVAQHYIAKQKNWGTGRNEGNGAVLEIVELNAVKGAVKTSGTAPVEFDLDTCDDYPTLKAKAKELGIELPGNISKVDLKAKIAEVLKPAQS